MIDFLKGKKDESKSIDRDIGFVEDCFEMCKDMVAFEGHSLGNFMENPDKRFLDELAWMRKIRTHYLDIIAKSPLGQDWCRSKHLCRIAMGLQELTTRFLSVGDIENAKISAGHAKEIYLQFLKINGYKEEDLNVSSSSA